MANMIPFTTEQILDLFKSAYYAETGRVMQIGSDEFAFSSVAAYVLRVFEQNLQKSADQTDITTATGKVLDNIGLTFGLTRPQAQHAKLFIDIKVTPNTSTQAGIGQIQADDGNVIFKNTYPISLYISSGSHIYAFLECEEPGSQYNGLSSFEFTFPDGIGIESIGFYNSLPSSGGTDSIDEYTQENDDKFREYILQNLDALSVGTARYYEELAKRGWDGIIVDTLVLRDGQTGFRPGIVDLYLAFNESITSIQYQRQVCADVERFLMMPENKCVTDSVKVWQTDSSRFQPSGVSIVYDERFQALLDNGKSIAQNHFENIVRRYANILVTKIGKPYDEGELCDMLTTPDADGVYARSYHSSEQYYRPPQNGFYTSLVILWNDVSVRWVKL